MVFFSIKYFIGFKKLPAKFNYGSLTDKQPEYNSFFFLNQSIVCHLKLKHWNPETGCSGKICIAQCFSQYKVSKRC